MQSAFPQREYLPSSKVLGFERVGLQWGHSSDVDTWLECEESSKHWKEKLAQFKASLDLIKQAAASLSASQGCHDYDIKAWKLIIYALSTA